MDRAIVAKTLLKLARQLAEDTEELKAEEMDEVKAGDMSDVELTASYMRAVSADDEEVKAEEVVEEVKADDEEEAIKLAREILAAKKKGPGPGRPQGGGGFKGVVPDDQWYTSKKHEKFDGFDGCVGFMMAHKRNQEAAKNICGAIFSKGSNYGKKIK